MVAVAGAAIDQWTKAWAEAHVRPVGIATLIPGVVDFRYVRNPGAFFGLGAGVEPSLRRAFFVVASLLVITLIAALHARTPAVQRQVRVGLSLLAAGSLGNLIDRLRTGDVVDFIHVETGSVFRWATFNAADIFISVGIALLVLDVLWRPDHAALQDRAGSVPMAHARSTPDGKAKA